MEAFFDSRYPLPLVRAEPFRAEPAPADAASVDDTGEL